MSWVHRITIFVTLLLYIFDLIIPASRAAWYEDKTSHKLKDLAPAEFKYLANNVSDSALFESLLDPLLIPRLPGTPNHTVVKEHILNHFSSLGWDISRDAFEDQTPYGLTAFENIVVTLNPDVPRRLVLACHYESKNFSAIPEFAAATDSAVPCAMLLHLATVLRTEFQAHKTSSQNVTLQFIFFDGEEAFRFWTSIDSIYGSRHLASEWENTPFPIGNQDGTNSLHRMDLLMLLDLLGALSPTFLDFSVHTSWLHVELFRLEQSLRLSKYWTGPIGSKSYFRLQRQNTNLSDDQIPFIQRGVEMEPEAATAEESTPGAEAPTEAAPEPEAPAEPAPAAEPAPEKSEPKPAAEPEKAGKHGSGGTVNAEPDAFTKKAKRKGSMFAEAVDAKELIESSAGQDITSTLQAFFKEKSGSSEKLPTQKRLRRPKLTYENTYRLDSKRPFVSSRVAPIIEKTLEEILDKVQYSSKTANVLGGQIAEKIRNRVLALEYERYKIVVHVALGSISRQGVFMACKAVGDPNRDSYAVGSFKNHWLFATATVHAVYYE